MRTVDGLNVNYLAKIFVTLKTTVNDPQGQTVMYGLKTLGFSSIRNLRVGKYLEVSMECIDVQSAEAEVRDMCDKLLANPVIEEFSYQIEETKVIG